jgi:hypothetical protein
VPVGDEDLSVGCHQHVVGLVEAVPRRSNTSPDGLNLIT